jgi:hypothetical protein
MWALIAAGTGAAAGLFNAVDEFNANRQIRRDLAQIKKYLIGLRQVIDRIEAQNVTILRILDELPEQVRRIVSEVVDIALLRERYTTIKDIKDNFLLLQDGEPYSLRSLEWLRFSEAMGYLFDHENRVSKTFELIAICEIALVITKERSLPIVLSRIDLRVEALGTVVDAHASIVQTMLAKLKVDLDNKRYIAGHNLSERLGNLDILSYTPQPDRLIPETYFVTEYYTVDGAGKYSTRTIRASRQVQRTRQVPDVTFHHSRDAHVKTISEQVARIAKELERLGQLMAARTTLSNYRRRIAEGWSEATLREMVMYFSDIQSEAADKAGPLAPMDEADFHDYIDGCHGDCHALEKSLAPRDNKSFVTEVC